MLKDRHGRDFYFSSDFIETVSRHYFVDKSLLIRDFIDSHPEVSLITRPRRFGKSINMDMMKTFFEKTNKNTSVYFKGLKIWQCGKKYTSEQGRYPVIHLDLKEMNESSFSEAMNKLKDLLAVEFLRHNELKTSRHVDKIHDRDEYFKIAKKTASDEELEGSLLLLSRMLHNHHKVKPIILIDEYDVPIHTGYEEGYYSDMVKFIRNFLSAGLKGNSHLNFAVLTGVTRVSKESIFSGLNNLCVYSVLDQRYSEYYGFTKDDVKTILEDFGAEDKYGEVCDWYDGYLFGNTEIFNPWSVCSYVDSGFKSGKYWTDTSSSGELKAVFDRITDDVETDLELLEAGKSVKAVIDENIPYDRLRDGRNVYALLLSCGYLKICDAGEEGVNLKANEHFLAIPNREIIDVYSKEIMEYVNNRYGGVGEYSVKILDALEKANVAELQTLLNDFMLRSMSVRDKREDFYHGMVLGIIGNLGGNYRLASNREYGDGMPDLSIEGFGYGLASQNPARPCIVFEFKHCGKLEKVKGARKTAAELREAKERLMRDAAEDALSQIEKRNYIADFKENHSRILKYGIAFYGKTSYVLFVENVDGQDVKKLSAKGEVWPV